MIKIPNLLVISGAGSKSGKTTLACRLIREFAHLSPVAVKITPHFHELTEGMVEINGGVGYSIRAETNAISGKETAKMLGSGASEVYLVLAWEAPLQDVFMKLMELIPEARPVICESLSLRNYIEPGIFIEDIDNSLELEFKDGKWRTGK